MQKSHPFKLTHNIKCEFCKKTFQKRELLLEHTTEFHTNKRVICEFCGKTYSRKSKLKEHVITFHENQNENEDEQLMIDDDPLIVNVEDDEVTIVENCQEERVAVIEPSQDMEKEVTVMVDCDDEVVSEVETSRVNATEPNITIFPFFFTCSLCPNILSEDQQKSFSKSPDFVRICDGCIIQIVDSK